MQQQQQAMEGSRKATALDDDTPPEHTKRACYDETTETQVNAQAPAEWMSQISDEVLLMFNEANVRNAVVNVKNVQELGERLRIPTCVLKSICNFPPEDQKLRLVEAWFNMETDRNWTVLNTAIKAVKMSEWMAQSSYFTETEFHIKTPNLREIRNALVTVQHKWFQIGIQLGVPYHKLEEFKKEDDPLAAVINYWLKGNVGDVPVCWKSIITALQSPHVAEIGMAKSIGSEYCPHAIQEDEDTNASQYSVKEQPGLIMVDESAKKRNMAMIKASFAKLLSSITKTLMQSVEDIEDFRHFIVMLFEAGGSIEQASSVREIFRVLNRKKYWDFLDVSSLECIVESFGGGNTKQIMTMITDYKEKLAGFKAATKLEDYIHQCGSIKEIEEESEESSSMAMLEEKYDERYRTKLSVKLFGEEGRYKLSMQSLMYVEELWKRLCSEFHMPSLPRVLDSIVPGSILIHWLIRHIHACRVLERLGDTGIVRGVAEFFQKESIINVYIEEICVYDQDTGVANERILGYVKLLIVVHERDQDMANSMLEQLLPDVNVPISQEGRTALMLAAQHGNKTMAQLLLDHGADMYLRDYEGGSILSLSQPHSEVHMWFRERLEEEMIRCARDNNWLFVERALKFGVDPNAKEKDEYGWTALLWACENGHSEVVGTLLEHGADVDAEDSSQWTSLILTSRRGYLHIVQKLLDKGADVNKTTNSLWTSLMWTAQSGHTEVAKLLLERGANADTRDKAGFSPLLQASQDGHSGMVKLLAEHGAGMDMNSATNNGWTAVMLATKNRHEDVLRYLGEHGSDVHHQKKDGITALHIASFKGSVSIIRYLCQEQDMDVNVQDEDGITPLMFAAEGGHIEVVRMLVEEGHADLNIYNDHKWTALFFAVMSRKQEVLEFLLNTGRADIAHRDMKGNTVVDLAKEVHPEAFEYLLKYHKIDTEAVLAARSKAALEPFNMKSYLPMLRSIQDKIEAGLQGVPAAGAA